MSAATPWVMAALKWNPLTAAPYALADHFGGVEKAKNAIGDLVNPQMPAGAEISPAPVAATSSAPVAARKARRRAIGAYGRSDTLLTGPLGPTTSPQLQRKTLLGL